VSLSIGVVCFASVGGSGTVGVELAHALDARGHRVTVLSTARPPRLRADMRFHPIPAIEHPLFTDSPYALALASTLALAHREHAFDLVHIHYGVPHAASALLARHALGPSGPAMVVTLHGSDVITFGADEGHRAIIGASLRALDAITTPSRYLAEHAHAAFGVRADVVANSVDGAVFCPEAARPELVQRLFGGAASDTPTLVHVSNLRPVKAALELVPMMLALRDEDVRLVIVGDGPERAGLETEVLAAGLGPRVRFVAPPPSAAALAAWVASCNVFVLPSENESFGLAALEALACGVPVVARHVGGLPEVVRDGASGLLVTPPRSLADAVRAILGAPATLDSMRREATADARRRFSTDASTDGYEAVYRRALSRWRGAAERDDQAGSGDA
jgi:N-acetyl-alpha-D-glucosaminyl L-malate synthase BshA